MKFKTNKLIILLFVFIACLISSQSMAQNENKDAKKRGPEYYAKKKKNDKPKDGKDEGKQRHQDIQSKETRKRMKRTAKKSKRQKSPKGTSSFFRRTFRKNR